MGVPVAAVQEERFSRRKGDSDFPLAAIEWCLGQAGLDPAIWTRRLLRTQPPQFERILTSALREFPRSGGVSQAPCNNCLGEKMWRAG